LGPLSTAANNRPIVPAPGDYDGEIGGMIGRGNRSTRRKPAPKPLCPQQPQMLSGREPGPPWWEASDGTASRFPYRGTKYALSGHSPASTSRLHSATLPSSFRSACLKLNSFDLSLTRLPLLPCLFVDQ
jgi:hypothetical protein